MASREADSALLNTSWEGVRTRQRPTPANRDGMVLVVILSAECQSGRRESVGC